MFEPTRDPWTATTRGDGWALGTSFFLCALLIRTFSGGETAEWEGKRLVLLMI